MSDHDRMRLRAACFLLSKHINLAPPWRHFPTKQKLTQVVANETKHAYSSHDHLEYVLKSYTVVRVRVSVT